MALFLLLTYGHEEDQLKLGTVIGVIWGAGIFITFSIVYIVDIVRGDISWKLKRHVHTRIGG